MQVRLNSGGRHFGIGRYGGNRQRQRSYGKIRDAVGRVEGRVLIHAVAERILQIVVHAESGADHGLRSQRTPGEADSRLRQKLRAIHCECRARDARLGLDHSAGFDERCGAAVRLIPSGGEFAAETERKSDRWSKAKRILHVPGAEQRAPVHLSGRRIVEKARDGSLQKDLQAGERGLAELCQREVFVRLQLLKPNSRTQIVPSNVVGDVVLVGIEVAVNVQIASGIAARLTQLRSRIGRCAAAYDNGSDRLAGDKTRHAGRRRAGRGFAGVKVGCARIAQTRRVQQLRRKHVCLLQARNLFAQRFHIGAVQVGAGRRHVRTVIHGVNSREHVFGGENAVHASSPEIVANGLQGAVECLGDAAEVGGIGTLRGPQIQQRNYAWRNADISGGQDTVARIVIGNEGDAGLMQVLRKALKVCESEGFVPSEGSAQRAAKLVTLEWRRRSLVKVVRRVENIVAQELVERAVHLICAALRDDEHLRARPFAVLGAVCVAEHVKLAHGIDAEQFLARAAGLHIVLSRGGGLHAIQQEEVLLRAIARDGKVIAHRGIRDADAAGLLGGEIDDAGIESQQFIVAAPVQREILHLLSADQSRDASGCQTDRGRVGIHNNLLLLSARLQADVDFRVLANYEVDSKSLRRRKAWLVDEDLIIAGRERHYVILAGAVGGYIPLHAGVEAPNRYCGSGDQGSR